MGLFGFGKPKDEALEQKIEKLDSQINDKKNLLEKTLNDIKSAKEELGLIQSIPTLEEKIKSLNEKIEESNKELAIANESLGLQEYGFFERQYPFSTSIEYSEKLKEIRQTEKLAVKNETACTVSFSITWNDSAAKGRTMQKRLIKAAIRIFNSEADALLGKVSISNYGSKLLALERSYEQINKLYSENGIVISTYYYNLKEEEIKLAAEFSKMKEDEKELLREQRAQEREDKKLQAEIAAAKKKLEKDKKHYSQVLVDLYEKLKTASEDEAEIIKANITEYENKVDKIQSDIEDVDYREGHATAGYVYIISNIGAFGPDVFKIGVTRRLEPLDRINELGSASVPFKFDVHALIFSENAFALETMLHQKFDKKKINKVNGRKEFFHVTLDEIKDALIDYPDISVEFNSDVESFEYKQSLIIAETPTRTD